MVNKKEVNIQNISVILIILSISLIPLFNAGFDNFSMYYLLISFAIINIILKNRNEIILSVNSSSLWIVLFILWGAISIIWSVAPVRTIIEFIQVSGCIAVFLSMKRLDYENKSRIVKFAVIIAVILTMAGVFEYIFILPDAMKGTFPHHNPFGIYISMLLLTTLGFNINENSKLYWIASVILLIGLILSASRGAMLCTILVLPLIYLNQDKKRIPKQLLKTVICIITGIILSYAIITCAAIYQNNNNAQNNSDTKSQVTSYVKGLSRTDQFEESAGGRLEFWRVAYKLWLRKPLTGYGNGAFYAAYNLEYGNNGLFSRFTHNHYLQVAAELGIVGLALFLGFLFTSLYAILERFKHRDTNSLTTCTFAASLAFVLHIGFDFSWNHPADLLIFFVLLAIAIGDEKHLDNKKVIKINYKAGIAACMLLIIITTWQLSSEIVFRKALSLSREGNITASNNLFEIGEKFYPINPQSYFYKASNYKSLYNTSNNPEYLKTAVELLKKSSSLMPYEWTYLNQLGEIYLISQDYNNAEMYLNKAVTICGYRIQPYFNLGVLYLKENKTAQAKEIFLKGIESEYTAFWGIQEKSQVEDTAAHYAIMHYHLANIFHNEGDKENADKHLNELNEYIRKYPEIKKYFEK